MTWARGVNVGGAVIILQGLEVTQLLKGLRWIDLSSTGGFILIHVRLFLTSLCCMSLVGARS